MDRTGVAFTGGLAPPEIVRCAALAEDCGYESVWIAEGHGGDQFALLAACAAATRRVRLGTAISSVFVRSAPTIAMAAATLDHLSGGRFVLGLGSSHRVQVEGEHGLPYARPIPRLRDTVAVVRALLRDGAVSYRGETLAIERFDLWFAPLRAGLPIYLSAVFEPMLEVCGELADGVLLNWSTLARVQRASERVAAGAARAGRPREAIELASLLPCALAATAAEARARLRPSVGLYAGYFPRYNRLLAESGFADAAAAVRQAWQAGDRAGAERAVPDELIDAIGLVGPAAACRARLQAYREAGLALPIVTPRVREGGGAAAVEEAIRACAP